MASRSSAFTKASLFSFVSAHLRLLGTVATEGVCFCCEAGESALGILFRDSGSLASRFSNGIVGVVAERISAIAPLGPRDMLRRCLSVSLDRLFSRAREIFEGAGLFVAVPGFGFGLDAGSGRLGTDLGGDTMIGPPSFLLIESHCAGSLAEKLIEQ